MSKLFTTLLSLSIISNLYAMENPLQDAAPETDEAFIARAKEKCKLIAAQRVTQAHIDEGGWWRRINFESSWQDADIKLTYTQGNNGASSIALSDKKNRVLLNDILTKANALLAQFTNKTNHYDVEHIAFSADARLIAFLKNPMIENPTIGGTIIEPIWRENVISIHEVESNDPSKQRYTFKVPSSLFFISGIEFNNQATKLIVFGRDYNQYKGLHTNEKYSTEHYHIFELDSATKSP